MKQHLFDHVDINPSNTFLPTCKKGQDPREQGLAYEKEIKEDMFCSLKLTKYLSSITSQLIRTDLNFEQYDQWS